MEDCKLISFYLPQFHEIPENNDAWGNGFTEWTNVKKSKPLYWGHNQPRVPLNNNYYNLLDEDTLSWQAELAKKYGIDAFCFYHYWFSGRMVLEKPVKKLLDNSSISLSYCFAWANEPWTKTWHGAGGNKEILLPQEYGREEEWEQHFQYFIAYFKDDRYIKKDKKPVLLIYKLQNIPFFNEMIAYWKNRAIEEGFAGIFLIVMKTGRTHVYKSRWVDATVDFEPNKTKAEMLESDLADTHKLKNKKSLCNFFSVKTIDYQNIYRKMLATKHRTNEYRTVFVDYDDTPRRGCRGIITRGSTPGRFQRFFEESLKLTIQEGNDFLFVNAWNEWGEGNYLEPDKRNKYRYLERIRDTKVKKLGHL